MKARYLITLLAAIGAWLPAVASRADDVRALPVPARDLLYDASTRRLFASVAGSAPNAGARANT